MSLLLLMPQSHRFWPQEANEVLKKFHQPLVLQCPLQPGTGSAIHRHMIMQVAASNCLVNYATNGSKGLIEE